MERVIAYIDGFNLYFGLKAKEMVPLLNVVICWTTMVLNREFNPKIQIELNGIKKQKRGNCADP
jgi:hypothetical protein